MSASQLAARLGLAQATVSALESSEGRGTIRLDTLRRAAEALNCSVVYALVPNGSLETIVRDRARMIAASHLRSIEHTMLLENQGLSDEEREDQLSAYIRDELDARSLWDQP